MMLPILISVSLAPGSYFFSARAAVAVIATTAASAAKMTCFLGSAGIVFSRNTLCFVRVSQVGRAGFCTRIALHCGAAHQRRIGQQALGQRHRVARILVPERSRECRAGEV